ncbi:MAG: hypothetical protein O3C27_17415 [Actinomycetota bacterium]|nr:hypothetical protein [Actinomycetota bacterium]
MLRPVAPHLRSQRRGGHCELVASQANERLVATNDQLEACSHLPQELIPVAVTERVVHFFEPVEVQHEQGERDARACTRSGDVQRRIEHATIGQPGEVIEHGLALELVPQFDLTMRVAGGHQTTSDLWHRREVGNANIEPSARPVVPPQSVHAGRPTDLELLTEV